MGKQSTIDYDRDSEKFFFRSQETESTQANGVSTTNVKETIQEIDETLNKKIKALADLAEKGEAFSIEQLKFLNSHKNDKEIAPEIQRFNNEYLRNIQEQLRNIRYEQIEICREVTQRWAEMKHEAMDPFSAFLFSFMTAYSQEKENQVRQSINEELGLGRINSTEKQDKIAKMINALVYNEGDVKIIHTETKSGEESVKIIKSQEEWSLLANDEDFKKKISDADVQTSVYSTTLEKFSSIENELKDAPSAYEFLRANLGEPAAQKSMGEIRLDVSQKEEIKQDVKEEKSEKTEMKSNLSDIEQQLKENYHQDIDSLKQNGIYDKIMNGERVTLQSKSGNATIEVALNKDQNGNLSLVIGNLTIKDLDKLSDEEKKMISNTEDRFLFPYTDNENNIRWKQLTVDNLPDQIKGHSVTNEEKMSMLKGESITLTDCMDGANNKYTAVVKVNLQKTENGVKPIYDVEPKGFTQKNEQSHKNDQKQNKGRGMKIGMN